MSRKLLFTSLIAGSFMMASISSVHASLYIYPVKGGVEAQKKQSDVTRYGVHSKTSSRYLREGSGDSKNFYYRGNPGVSRDADLTINSSREPLGALSCYGRQVPIEVAVDHIFSPPSVVSIAPSVSGTRVSWSLEDSSCNSVEDIVDKINEAGSVYINYADVNAPIGVGSNKREAGYYSYENPKVWHSDPTLSIRENLTLWAESEGWSVEWPDIMNKIDFESTRTTLYGELIGDNGVFHRVIRQISQRDPNVTLSLQFWANNYIVVTQGGYENINKGSVK